MDDDAIMERFKHLVRGSDPGTSIAAAIKAVKSSAIMTHTAWRVMIDGKDRIDEEIWVECRKYGRLTSLSTVQHARRSLMLMGYVENTGIKRRTSDGGSSIAWVISRKPDAELPKLLLDENPPPSRRHVLRARSVRLAPKKEQACTWLVALRTLCLAAKKRGIKLDNHVLDLGRWLKEMSGDDERCKEPKP